MMNPAWIRVSLREGGRGGSSITPQSREDHFKKKKKEMLADKKIMVIYYSVQNVLSSESIPVLF